MILKSFKIDDSVEVKLTREEVRKIKEAFHYSTDSEDSVKLKDEFINLYDLISHGNLDEFVLKYRIRNILDKDKKDD